MMRHIAINPLFILVVFLSWYTRNLASFLITYASLILHEGIHLYFLCRHKIPIQKIMVEPFGISIQTDCKMPQNTIVYLSAPFGNLLLAGVFVILQLSLKDAILSQWILANLSLGAVNLLPILPLDGGRALLLIMERTYGKEKATRRMTFLSCGVLIPMLLTIIFLIGKANGSFGLILVFIFICYTLLSGNRLFEYQKLRNHAFRRNAGIFERVQTVEHIGVCWDYPAKKLLKNFRGDKYYVVNIFKEGKLLKTVTETQILNRLLTANHNMTVSEC